MSRSQTSFFTTDPFIRSITFPALLGLARDTDIYQMNSREIVVPSDRFMFGQSKVLGFKRITSSPNPANNGTPYLVGIYSDVGLPSPVITTGTTQIEVYNPFRNNVLVITSSSGADTSVYEMFWVNEYANDAVAESLGLVSQKVFPDPNEP
jgi:hypothetical protein